MPERETERRSVRLLFDLQACQTEGSAHRGVGRYSQALFSAMLEVANPRRIHALASAQRRNQPDLRGVPGNRRHYLTDLPQWGSARDHSGGDQDTLDALAVSSLIATIEPDLVHISHVFEGYSDRVALPSYSNRPLGQVLSATLYDLIPYRYPESYLANEDFARWYAQRTRWLRNADLLLSISESSRSDAIAMLDLDPSRIVTIHGGISDHFKRHPDPAGIRAALLARYGISRLNVMLYTGGDDYRKNIAGAIQAFAVLPADLRASAQLVIICSITPDRKAVYLKNARRAGLTGDDIVFTGLIPEDDLVAFYSVCDVFVFPSLYEGLGLPVLEAMACGAPVIGGDNSSIRELIGDPDAMFDAADVNSIAAKMAQVLTDCQLAEKLRQHGLARAPLFTWERSAKMAVEAMDEALARKRQEGVAAARSGWLKRQRLAVLTPLPPSRSGIADYNAAFLPHLAMHFDIDLFVDQKIDDRDLNAGFRVFDVRNFDAVAPTYDAILYELGNSEFHVHMLPLLERHPGVVGLHDAFLGGMMAYLQFQLGEPDGYFREVLDAHAGVARRYMAPISNHPDAVRATKVDLPCISRVLKAATGIISHSPFNIHVANRFHPEGWRASWRIIPQMVALPKQTELSRENERARLGISPDDFVITTFGHIAWTKWGDRLLEAFVESGLASDSRCRLIYAGELAKDDFGIVLNQRIRKLRLGDRIRITNFLSETDYARYLRVSDCAVQLRKKSRGGTPKGVLDCLAHGLPVLVNNEASYADYTDDVVIKVSSDPSPTEIGRVLVALRESPAERKAFSLRGRAYVRDHHNPKICAAQYAAAIAEFSARTGSRQTDNIADAMAPYLASMRSQIQAAKAAAKFIDSRPTPNFSRRRIAIDVSYSAGIDHMTGVTRVVTETVKASYRSQRPGFEALAVRLEGIELVEAKDWLHRHRLLLPYEAAAQPRSVGFAPGDHLLMLDSSWARYAEFAPAQAAARSSGASITTAVYDLLPITLPPGDIVQGGRDWFQQWLRQAVLASDSLVCISRTVADDLLCFIEREQLARPGLKVGWWHLGTNPPMPAECPARSAVHNVSQPYLLMVGTIAPHKNQALALDALEELWHRGEDLALVFAGKPGWLVDDFVSRLQTHPQLHRRLFWSENPTDGEIGYLYRNAAAVMMLSKGEGFGLPLLEASQFGTPIVASDIPVFHEIVGDHATYADTADAGSLANDLSDWRKALDEGRVRGSLQIPRLTWEESTERLIDVLLDEHWYVVF